MDPNIQIIQNLDAKVCKYQLHWAIWIFSNSFGRDTIPEGPHLPKLGSKDEGFRVEENRPIMSIAHTEVMGYLRFAALWSLNDRHRN